MSEYEVRQMILHYSQLLICELKVDQMRETDGWTQR